MTIETFDPCLGGDLEGGVDLSLSLGEEAKNRFTPLSACEGWEGIHGGSEYPHYKQQGHCHQHTSFDGGLLGN